MDYEIGLENTMTKVFKDTFRVEVKDYVEISLARNEYEGFQLVILPKRDLGDVQISCTDLTSGHGRIARDNIVFNLVGYVQTRKPAYPVEHVGLWPDPLLDYKPFSVKANEAQPVWVNVYAPPSVPAGKYVGKITVEPEDSHSLEVRLDVNVWDFSLPRESPFRTSFGGPPTPEDLAAFHSLPEDSLEVFRNYIKLMLDHKVTPRPNWEALVMKKEVGTFDYSMYDEILGWAINYGLTSIPVGNLENLPLTRDCCQHLQEKGLLHKAFCYVWDEPTREDYPKIRERIDELRKVSPDLKILLTMDKEPFPADFLDDVNIWVPMTRMYIKNTEAAIDGQSRCQKEGKEVWWYVCCQPWHPAANLFIDYPAIDYRILFWQAWRYGVDGFLYWSTCGWDENTEIAQEDFPDLTNWNTFSYRNFNGDGHLIYPGQGGKPISSIRLKNIRDGIEDYEYLWLLRQRTRKVERRAERYRELLGECYKCLSVEDVTKSLTEYTKDPRKVYEARMRCARLIAEVDRVEQDGS